MNRKRFFILIAFPLFIAINSMLWRRLVSTGTMMSTSSPKTAIVVGSGLAGLSAASQLVAHGITVHLLERATKPGGNSIKASSGINGAPTKYQPGPPFSDTTFYSDTLNSTGKVLSIARLERESLISTLTNSSSEAISWLADEKGVDLSVVAELGGHSFPRTHRGAGKTPPGAAIVTTLLKALNENPLFHLETLCAVKKVLKTNNEVIGVEYTCDREGKELYGPVIFASGGFAGDTHGMLAQYRPDLAGFPSTNDAREGSQKLLTDIGAQLRDMELVQVHPTSFIDPKDPSNPVKFLAAELLRGEGGVLLYDGKRFINEMETRKNITDSIMMKPTLSISPRQWHIQLVIDEGVYDDARSHVDFYAWKGLMKKIKASDLGPNILTIQEYANMAAGRTIDPLGRQYFGRWKLDNVTPESVLYVGLVTPAVHFTMGGAVINTNSEVLDEVGHPIKGLWAAGEVTGGIHGENRLGGSSLLECVVFGRIAGNQVAKYFEKHSL